MTAVRESVGHLLQAEIGLDVASITPRALQQAIHDRLREIGGADEAAYLELLRHSRAEREALIDAVIVPETWFFRDGEPFSYLESWLQERCEAGPARLPLRILSMPCASGEEPFSIAMILAGYPQLAEQAVIHGVDVSRRLLERAGEGVYGRHALRAVPEAMRKSFFRVGPEGELLEPAVRERVRFFQANALEFPGEPPGAAYDVVFCRNLLIYLDQPSRRRLAEVLDRLLSPGGVLFLGHAEVPHLFCPTYRPVRWPRCFAAVKPGREQAVPPPAPVATANISLPAPSPGRPGPCPAAPPRKTSARPVPPGIDPAGWLREARELADRGLLEESRQRCQAVLAADMGCAEAYSILGLVAEAARDDTRAIEMFQKAIYLEPRHVQALTQLGLIMERQGRTEQARRYRDRARRVAAGRKPTETVSGLTNGG